MRTFMENAEIALENAKEERDFDKLYDLACHYAYETIMAQRIGRIYEKHAVKMMPIRKNKYLERVFLSILRDKDEFSDEEDAFFEQYIMKKVEESDNE